MTQEDKQLLLVDLFGRLLYGVKVLDDMGRTYTLVIGTSYLIDLFYGNGDYVDAPIKPYLRPLSTMTEEEKEEYHELCDSYCGIYFDSVRSVDWLNKKMFDYRGLIPMGLADEAPEGMYNV